MGPDQKYQQKWLCRIAMGGILACAYLAAWGQSGAQPPPSATYTLPIEVNRVLVPAVVRDKAGHVVSDLKAQDFRVLDNGKPREITGFMEEITNPAAQMPASPAAAAGVPPGHAQPTAPRFTLLLFDDLHLNVRQLARAKKAAAELLAKMPLDRNYAAVASLSGHTHSNFTHDRSQLQKTLKKLKLHNVLGRGSQFCPKMDYYQAFEYLVAQNYAVAQEMLQQMKYCMKNFTAPSVNTSASANMGNAASQMNASGAEGQISASSPQAGEMGSGDAYALGLNKADQSPALRQLIATAREVLLEGETDVQNSFSQLTASVNAMTHLPGPRLIILISPGFFVGAQEGQIQESQLVDTADRGQVIISSLDPRGVASSGKFLNTSQGVMPNQADVYSGGNDFFASQGVMADVAQGTGGTFYHGNNDLNTGFERLAQPPECMYLLEIPLDGVKPNGLYHQLKVKVDRAGVTVQARRGYLAPKEKRKK